MSPARPSLTTWSHRGGCPAQLETAAQAGLPVNSLMYSDKNNWSPRIGLAFRPFGNDKTVARARLWRVYLDVARIAGARRRAAHGSPHKTGSSSTINLVSRSPIRLARQPRASMAFRVSMPSIPISLTSAASSGMSQLAGRYGRPRSMWRMWAPRAKIFPFYQNLNLLAPSTTPFSTDRLSYPLFNDLGYNQTGGSSSLSRSEHQGGPESDTRPDSERQLHLGEGAHRYWPERLSEHFATEPV